MDHSLDPLQWEHFLENSLDLMIACLVIYLDEEDVHFAKCLNDITVATKLKKWTFLKYLFLGIHFTKKLRIQ